MTKRVSSPHIATNASTSSRLFAISARWLSIASLIVSLPLSALAAHTTKPPAREESVLVATREAPPSTLKTTNADAEALEPTAQSSDHNPDLANSSESGDAGTQFGEALAKVAQPIKQETSANNERAATASRPWAETARDNGSARRAAAARSESMHYDAVKFQGIAVGKSTKHELTTTWGHPDDAATTAEGEVLIYRKPPFQAIEVLVGTNGIVASIKITLAAPLESKRLTEQLSLDRIGAATIADNAGKPLGLAFPERGVMFMYARAEKITPVDEDKPVAAAATTVSHVVIEPLDPHAFVLRAENHLNGPYTQNINDLKTAISLDPEFAYAYCLLAKIYLATGQADLADAAAAEACDIEPKNASFQLCRAQARELLGEYDDAVLKVRAVLDREDLAPIDRAQAQHQMGRLASLGDGEIASKTITFETRAIDIADKLANSKDARERHAAKQLLVEAHIGIAEEIARQSYNQKVESLSLWVGRASGLAEDYIANDGGSVELRLYISQRVLASLASFKPTRDPRRGWPRPKKRPKRYLRSQTTSCGSST